MHAVSWYSDWVSNASNIGITTKINHKIIVFSTSPRHCTHITIIAITQTLINKAWNGTVIKVMISG